MIYADIYNPYNDVSKNTCFRKNTTLKVLHKHLSKREWLSVKAIQPRESAPLATPHLRNLSWII